MKLSPTTRCMYNPDAKILSFHIWILDIEEDEQQELQKDIRSKLKEHLY